MGDTRTMQQIDHDAWEEGYGNRYTTNDHNSLELNAMYEALARRNAEVKPEGDDQEPQAEEDSQQQKHDAWANDPNQWQY